MEAAQSTNTKKMSETGLKAGNFECDLEDSVENMDFKTMNV